MPTRSLVLVADFAYSNQLTVIFTTPAGYTVILKSVLVLNREPGASSAEVYLWRPSTSTRGRILTQSLAANTGYEWNGWVALDPGDSIRVVAGNEDIQCWISGAKLPGVA